MAQYASTITSLAPGSGVPAGWTDRWATVSLTTTVPSEGSPVGFPIIRRTPTVASRRLISWDTLNADAGRATLDVVMLHRPWTANPQKGCALRASGPHATATGIVVQLFGGMRAVEFVNGSPVAIHIAGSFYPDESQWSWLRAQVEGTTLRLKGWLLDDPQPAGWNLVTSGLTITTAGWAGIYSGDTAAHDTGFFAVGTGGDEAPNPFSPVRTPGGLLMAAGL